MNVSRLNQSQIKSPAPLLIRGAELLSGAVFDLRIADGKIVEKSPHLQSRLNERVIEAGGHLLIPGLQDHHLHLFATASARESIYCGPPAVTNEQQLRQVLESAPGRGWLRGIGFHDSVCAELDRYWLDRVCPDRPVRIQHRSGMMWVLNSKALQQLTLKPQEDWPDGVERNSDGELSGRFYNLDSWLGDYLPRAWPSLLDVSKELARYGVTRVTDTGVNNDKATWEALNAASERHELMQRALVMGTESLNQLTAINPERMNVGPLKLYLREVDLPDLDNLVKRIGAAHDVGRAVAVHCVTLVELYYVLEAFSQAGVLLGDRIEHASVADTYAIERLAALGITVVTQPHFISERGDQYLTDVDKDDVARLYRGASFLKAGVRLAAGSDAPYGSLDPWASMKAATIRQTRSGIVMAAEERLTPLQALALFGGTSSQPGIDVNGLKVGDRADLCLLDTSWQQQSQELCASHVALTLCGGRVIFESHGRRLRKASG
ncbi:MAG: amidohydrolase family protein [Spongiibacteraceae bacterium]|nr:amidohydrolase family protein [Spongiibacteraceae bacterium]